MGEPSAPSRARSRCSRCSRCTRGGASSRSRADGATPGEIGLDETGIRPSDRAPPARIRRVEIEVLEDAVDVLEPFVDMLREACGLQPAGLSKYQAGLLSADLAAAAAGDWIDRVRDRGVDRGRRDRGPEASVRGAPREGAGHAARRRHRRVARHVGRDATAPGRLSCCGRAPENAQSFREELGWIGQARRVRDLDVQLEQLDQCLAEVPEADREALGFKALAARGQAPRGASAMLEALDSRRYEAFLGRFGTVPACSVLPANGRGLRSLSGPSRLI